MRETSEDAEPYHVGGFQFKPGCGIYFVVSVSYDCEPLLEQLSYSGLGGKRSSGYGRFAFEILDASPFSLVGDGGSCERAMLLTSALPCEEELTDDLLAGAKYRLEKKGGFVQSAHHSATPRKKRSMWLFVPGSVFGRRFCGDVFDVNATAGAHPVWRYARALWMEV